MVMEPKNEPASARTPKARPRYCIMEHEADTGLIIYGRRYEDLFVNGAYALFSLVFDLRKIRKWG